ncbi:hypothetical protein L873DRAFT_1816823 [Choiromyces venosus 120613-1]|uniref:Uncharacterized protein n=1 Tax=Choiromyces venosus 120613-1 TaxID=1336337 RepID=A0A3N4J8W6_9PEZI|nr:hypothetical protein L873DRAFT_1816823 [Choiromyces venosus 120613-1]
MVQVSMINNFELQSQNYPPPAMLEDIHPLGKLSWLFKSSPQTPYFLINATSHFLLSDNSIGRNGLILYSPHLLAP